jgi:hypothetical protein
MIASNGADLDIVIAQALQPSRRGLGEILVPLDGVDPAGDPAHHGGGVAGAGPHLQHLVPRPKIGRIEHQADDVGLGDGLACLDRKRGVVIGELPEALGHEALARHVAHGLEHPVVADAASGDLALHHPVTGFDEVEHGGSPAHPRLALGTADPGRLFRT